jgi:hypothetical protein
MLSRTSACSRVQSAPQKGALSEFTTKGAALADRAAYRENPRPIAINLHSRDRYFIHRLNHPDKFCAIFISLQQTKDDLVLDSMKCFLKIQGDDAQRFTHRLFVGFASLMAATASEMLFPGSPQYWLGRRISEIAACIRFVRSRARIL